MKSKDRPPEREAGNPRRAEPPRAGEAPGQPRRLDLSELNAVVGGVMVARNPKSPFEEP